jgi:hypothetical protein
MKRTLLSLFALVLFLSATSAKAQQQIESKTGNASVQQQADSSGLPASPSGRAVQTPKAEQTTDRQQAQSNQKLTTYNKLSLAAQYLIFLATLIYAWIAHRQLRAINSSAQAAILSAKAALQGNRPIMVVTDIQISGFNEPEVQASTVRKVKVSFRFHNRGNGIAFVKDVFAYLGFKDEFGDEPELENLLYFSDPMIGPDELTRRFSFPSVYPLIIDEARRHAMVQLAKQLQLWGRIDYTDMAQQDRFTRFAYGFDEDRGFYRLAVGSEYDSYAERRHHYREEPQGYFARLKAFFWRRGTNRPVTHSIRR